MISGMFALASTSTAEPEALLPRASHCGPMRGQNEVSLRQIQIKLLQKNLIPVFCVVVVRTRGSPVDWHVDLTIRCEVDRLVDLLATIVDKLLYVAQAATSIRVFLRVARHRSSSGLLLGNGTIATDD